MTDQKNELYPKNYGAWAGNPAGNRPDYAYCCVEVYPNERGGAAHRHQCNRKRGHGPDGAYCKLHDPAAVKKRDQEKEKRGKERWRNRMFEIYGRHFYDVLVTIAEGHSNDARGLAREAVDEFNK